jgi:hypothetical protein
MTAETSGSGDAGKCWSDSLLQESRFTWFQGNGSWSTRIGRSRIDVGVDRGFAVFRTSLLRVRKELSPDAILALTDFLMALNGSLRFARAIMTGSEVALEAVMPVAALTPALVDRAVDALVIGAARAKDSCAALAGDGVSEWYLKFHRKGRFNHADTDADCRDRGLEPVAGGRIERDPAEHDR